MKPRHEVYDFEAIGTHWWIESFEQPLTIDIRQQIDEYVSNFTRRYSRFDDSSLISQLNQSKILNNPPPELLDMLAYARQMFDASDGIFNISVSGTLHRFGFGSKLRANRADLDLWHHLQCNREQIIMSDNVTVDIDGFAKGWMIDDIAKLLARNNISQYIVNGGGDMYVSALQPVEIALEHPYQPDKFIGRTYISRGALAVSSIVKRSWRDRGKQHHHIIDPRRDDSADSGIISSYIKAPTSLLADTIATILLVEPLLQTRLTDEFAIEAILVTEDQFRT